MQTTDKINQLMRNLKSHERIEILFDGTILISHKDSQGRRKTRNMGKLNDVIAPDFKIKTKLWVNIKEPALKPYRDFGKIQKKTDKSIYITVIMGMHYLESQIQFKKLIEKIDQINYDVVETLNYKLFSYSGVNRFIVDKNSGKKYYIPMDDESNYKIHK